MSKTSETLHKKKIANQDIVREIQQVTKENLLPNIEKKAQEVSEYIEKEIKKINASDGLTSTQVFDIIANRSISDIATASSKGYTPQELAIALNIYMEMMSNINKYIKMPPSKSTFCLLLGIGKTTYNNYLEDPERANIMDIIETYITGAKLSAAQTGDLREISTMFELKASHGFVEAQNPVVIKHETKVDIDDIRSQLKEMKKGRVIDADYTEK